MTSKFIHYVCNKKIEKEIDLHNQNTT